MHTPSLMDYNEAILADDWEGVAKLMLRSAHKLAQMGADFLICPDNTIHKALPKILESSPLPWLHIAEIVAAEAARRGYKRLGVTGTKWLVESSVYPEKLRAQNVEYVLPTRGERETLNQIIMTELIRGIFKPESTAYFQSVIQNMAAQGCDAVVLGCTEIPLIIGDHNCALPTLDSTRLLARAALQHAVASKTN